MKTVGGTSGEHVKVSSSGHFDSSSVQNDRAQIECYQCAGASMFRELSLPMSPYVIL